MWVYPNTTGTCLSSKEILTNYEITTCQIRVVACSNFDWNIEHIWATSSSWLSYQTFNCFTVNYFIRMSILWWLRAIFLSELKYGKTVNKAGLKVPFKDKLLRRTNECFVPISSIQKYYRHALLSCELTFLLLQ